MGREGPIFHPLLLRDRIPAPQAWAPKGQSIRDLMIGLDRGRFGADRLAPRGSGQVRQQNEGAFHPADLAKGVVEMVLGLYTPSFCQRREGSTLPAWD